MWFFFVLPTYCRGNDQLLLSVFDPVRFHCYKTFRCSLSVCAQEGSVLGYSFRTRICNFKKQSFKQMMVGARFDFFGRRTRRYCFQCFSLE